MFDIGKSLKEKISDYLDNQPVLAMAGSLQMSSTCNVSCFGGCSQSCTGGCEGGCKGGCTHSCKGSSR